MGRELLSPRSQGSLPNNHQSSMGFGTSVRMAMHRKPGRWTGGLVLLLFIGLVFNAASRRDASAEVRGINEMENKQVDEELIKLLVKQKAAMSNRPPVDDLAGYADRVIVLQELDAFSDALPTRFPRLNSTTLSIYQNSLAYHHDKLFAELFPYISRSPTSPRPLSSLRARYTRPHGIIIPCGRDQFHFAVHLIATLKHVHKTILPIQVVYAGNDDLPGDRRAALRSISPDVETIDLLHFFDEDWVGLQNGGWAIKVFAVIASQFEKVIIVDSDAIFIQDPIVLFDNPGFNATGTYYFRDREIFPGDGNVHEWWAGVMKGREPSAAMAQSRWWTDRASREEMESGVVVFDKGRKDVLMGLIFVGYLNTKRVREPVTYAFTYGDKESFWMGFELAKIPYHLDPDYAAIIGQLRHPDKRAHSISSGICSEHLFHLDYKGKPLWWNGSLMQEKRVKDNGWFHATHWAHGTVDWDCDHEPWCMIGIREGDVKTLSPEEHSLLTHMIGMAVFWERQFPELIDKHY